MSKIFTSLLAVAASLTAVSALPSELDSRAVTGNFSLFAYGSDSDTTIGGYPIFYHDGIAYIANPALVNRTADYAVFNKNTSDTTQWLASALTAGPTTTNWDEASLYVTIPSGPVGFYKEGVSNVSTSSIQTTGFKFYGTTAMLKVDGTLQTLWYAVATAYSGLWIVGWNATDVAGAELLTLKSVAPTNVDYPQ